MCSEPQCTRVAVAISGNEPCPAKKKKFPLPGCKGTYSKHLIQTTTAGSVSTGYRRQGIRTENGVTIREGGGGYKNKIIQGKCSREEKGDNPSLLGMVSSRSSDTFWARAASATTSGRWITFSRRGKTRPSTTESSEKTKVTVDSQSVTIEGWKLRSGRQKVQSESLPNLA